MIGPASNRNGVACSKCGTVVPVRHYGGVSLRCPGCRETLGIELYPAFYRGSGKVQSGEAVTAEGEATCYYHRRKKAAVFCQDCGRFVCSLCEVRIGDKSLCPTCIEKGLKGGAMESLTTHRTLYDSMSLSLSLLPMLFVFITCITAPISIYVALKNWNKPGSLLPRTKLRFVCAVIFSSLQIIGWGALLVMNL